jgi:hypothetical protein
MQQSTIILHDKRNKMEKRIIFISIVIILSCIMFLSSCVLWVGTPYKNHDNRNGGHHDNGRHRGERNK